MYSKNPNKSNFEKLKRNNKHKCNCEYCISGKLYSTYKKLEQTKYSLKDYHDNNTQTTYSD